jgi:tRNA(Ile)-lysidine synthase
VSHLERKVWDCVRSYSLIAPGDRVLVAFSGGPDSVALTEILLHLRQQIPFEIALFHLNHGLRGFEAERDEQFCLTFARDRGLPIFVERSDVGALRLKEGLSLEEAARKVRYALIREIAQKWGASKVALGHTLDDQAETVLMNFIRGTGLRGLSGMRMRSDIFIRPLLTSSRREVLEFLQARGIAFVEDSSNRDPSFFRNRIRLLLMPLLEELNPRFKEALLRLSWNVQEEIGLGEAKPDFPWEGEKGVTRVSLDFLLSFSEEKRLFVLRYFIERARGNLWDVTREHLKAIAHIVAKKKGVTILPGKLRVWIEEGYLYASPLFLPLLKTPPWEFPITLPGQNILSEVGLSVEGNLERALKVQNGWSVTLDFDKSTPPFLVRNFREGDRICKDGKMKKVKEIFEGCGLCREWRTRIPFLCDQEKILWIPGIALDERVVVQENSRRILSVAMRMRKR